MSEPCIEDGWLCEPCEPDYAPGISQAIPGSWSEPIVNLTELDGHDELIAAAEQRGAARAFKESANEVRREMRWQYEQNINRNSDTGDSIDRLFELEKVFKYRADQEGDE